MTLTLGAAMLTACGSSADDVTTPVETDVVDTTTAPVEESTTPATEVVAPETTTTEANDTDATTDELYLLYIYDTFTIHSQIT